MELAYFNHRGRIAAGWLDRLSFTRGWWRLYAGDPRWVPPSYPNLRRALEPGRNPHLARLEPVFLSVEALPGRPSDRRGGAPPGAGWNPAAAVGSEQPVAAAVLLRDPRRDDGAVYLALLHCVNEAESLERLLDLAAEQASVAGSRRLLAPTGLSPYLGSGLLQDTWDRLPPLHSPYDPPYLPELFEALLEPVSASRLYCLRTAAGSPPPQGELEIRPVEPLQLAEDLLPLFAGSLSGDSDLPPPDAAEARFLLEWIGAWPARAWLARSAQTPVGFILLGPDLAAPLLRARGGRGLLGRAWLAWASGRPVKQGRLYLGGVLPGWRGRGIGRRLLQHALHAARAQGWEQLTAGPVPDGSVAAHVLQAAGARPAASYRLYGRSF